tara:strand:+ start:815 stop:994 length:180 start_codon:yes stop_codon:yes gene_type:complete
MINIKEPRLETVNVRLSQLEKTELRILSDYLKISKSDLIRKAIDKYKQYILEKEKNNLK